MHDPLTQVFDIRIPLPWKARTFWKDGHKDWATFQLATIWHKDPEKDGTNDSCGWFKRARHGDKKILAAIEKRFAEDWDKTWTYDPSEDGGAESDDFKLGKRTYMRGYFNSSGMPRMSAQGVVLNLFFIAAHEHFKCNGLTNWKKSKRFMRKHLFDIMLFAENPVDSMFDSLFLTFGKDSKREERISNFAAIIYAWILRADQPWYRHARWHIHHWRIQIHFLQLLKRWLFARCCRCKKGFRWNESVIGSWSGKEIWHDRCDETRKPVLP